MSTFSIRQDCHTCDLFMERSNRCRVVEVTDWKPPAWTRALSQPPKTWLEVITDGLDDSKRRRIATECGQRDAAARAYLSGIDPRCSAQQPRRRFTDRADRRTA